MLAGDEERTFFLLQLERLHRPSIAIALVDPIEELRHAVDLIVITSVGELQQLGAEVVQPFRAPGQKHVPCFDLGALRAHARDFVPEPSANPDERRLGR